MSDDYDISLELGLCQALEALKETIEAAGGTLAAEDTAEYKKRVKNGEKAAVLRCAASQGARTKRRTTS